MFTFIYLNERVSAKLSANTSKPGCIHRSKKTANFWQVTYKYLNSTNQNWNTKFFDSLYYFPDNFIKILQNIVKRPIQKVDIDI